MGSMSRGKELAIMNNCPYKLENRRCRLEVDYMILKETLRELEEPSQQKTSICGITWNKSRNPSLLMVSQ